MNELQLALAAVGVAAVAAVWGYNKWQERKHRRLAEKVFGGQQADVLLAGQEAEPASGEARKEPVIEPVAAEVADEVAAEGLVPRVEPVLAAAPGDETARPAAPPPLPGQWADELADCVIRLDFMDPQPAAALWAAQAAWAGHVGKPMSWLVFDERGGAWRRLDADDPADYIQLWASLQLADRRGAVSDSELSVFLAGVRQLAQQFSGLAEVPVDEGVLMHARSLDEFCAGVDVQLGVNVVEASGGGFPGTKLRGLAEAGGLTLAADGSFHARDEDGTTLFTVANLGGEPFQADTLRTLTSHGVTFSLDVPRVADGPAVFTRMVNLARQFAQGMGGVLVDGQRNPLADTMIATIRAKIGEVQQKMAAHQIPAGSVRAQRLFS